MTTERQVCLIPFCRRTTKTFDPEAILGVLAK